MHGKRHVMADHLSRIKNREPPTGVNNQLPDANLFSMEILNNIKEKKNGKMKKLKKM